MTVRISSSVSESLKDLGASGWALVGGVDPKSDLSRLFDGLGTPTPSSLAGPAVDLLEAHDVEDARPRSLSAEVGLARFPWHTEGSHWPTPPRYFALRFVSGERAPPLLAPFDALELSADDLRLFRRSVFRVASPRGKFLTTILESRGRSIGDIVRFDRRVLQPATPDAWQATNRLGQVLEAHEPLAVDWEPGLVLIVDNWRVLHSREAVEGDRTLERVLLRA